MPKMLSYEYHAIGKPASSCGRCRIVGRLRPGYTERSSLSGGQVENLTPMACGIRRWVTHISSGPTQPRQSGSVYPPERRLTRRRNFAQLFAARSALLRAAIRLSRASALAAKIRFSLVGSLTSAELRRGANRGTPQRRRGFTRRDNRSRVERDE